MNPEDSHPGPDTDNSSAEALSMEQINELLAKEDPRFVESLKDLGDLKAPEGMKLEPLGIEVDVLEGESPPAPTASKGLAKFRAVLLKPIKWVKNFSLRKLIRRSKVLSRRALQKMSGLLRQHLKWWSLRYLIIKRWSKTLTPAARNSLWMMFFCLMAMAGAAASLGKFDLRALIEGVELQDLSTVADQVYHFEADTRRESFFSPLRRPEAYILLESMVIQLKPSPRASLPKLFVEYIVEASSQRAAHEIQQKEGLLRDQLARVTESFTLEELRNPEGKARLKEVVKQRVNDLIETGYVRNVYFKKFLTQ